MMLHSVDEKHDFVRGESKVSFCTSKIDSAEVRRFNVDLTRIDFEMIVLGYLTTSPEGRGNFAILEMKWRLMDDSTTGIILPKEEGPYKTHEDLPLRPMLVPRGSLVEIAVKNTSLAPLVFSGEIALRGLAKAAEAGQPASLLERCRAWFLDGLREAVADKLTGRCGCDAPAPKVPEIPRVIDSLRRAAASLADLAEIPAVAASLYWRSVANLGHEEEEAASKGRTVVYWFSLSLLPGQEGHASIEVGGRFTTDRIYLDPCDVGALLTGYRNFCTQDLMSFGEPVVASGLARMSSGLDMRGDLQAKAGETIEIHVRNAGNAKQTYRGFLLGRDG